MLRCCFVIVNLLLLCEDAWAEMGTKRDEKQGSLREEQYIPCRSHWKKEKEIMKIKVTQKLTYLEAKKIQENQPEITFAKVVQSLNTKPETKETSTQFNENDSVIKANLKVITPTKKPKPKPASTHQSRPPTKSQNSSQTQPSKASGSQRSRSRNRTADQKEKNGKEKDKESNPYSKGGSADPIKLVNRFDSLESMELEIDSSMLSQTRKK